VVLGALVLVVGGLLSQGLFSSLNYFKTVDEVVAHRMAVGTTDIRLEGVVKPGSVIRTTFGANFVLTGTGRTVVTVHATGTPPQLFQANIPVVVVGHFTTLTNYTFAANQIMVKHSASYIAQNPTRVTAPNGSVR
jgi:cytochrome c-type biogenesis protein CcmE